MYRREELPGVFSFAGEFIDADLGAALERSLVGGDHLGEAERSRDEFEKLE